MADYSGFIGTTSGAVQRPVFTKVVAQDGTGDYNGSTIAIIQTALDAVGVLGGGSVKVMDGTYTGAAGLTLTTSHDNIILSGNGPKTILKLNNGSDDQIIDASNVDNFTLRDMKLDGNGANQTAGWASIWTTCTNVLIEKVWVYQPRQGAFLFDSCSYCKGQMCKYQDRQGATTADPYLIKNSKYCGFVDCYGYGSTHANDNIFGIYGTGAATNSEHNYLIGCTAEASAGKGLNFEYCSNSRIIGCTAIDCTGDGITINTAGSTEMIVEGCNVDSCSDGISINSGARITVTGCTFANCTNRGAVLSGDHILFKGNIIRNIQNHGIDAYQGTYLNICGNLIQDCNQANATKDGIRLTNTYYAVVSGNTILNTGATKHNYGIYVYLSAGSANAFATITGNAVYDSAASNIYGYNALRCSVVGNVTGAGTYGVRSSTGCDYWTVTGNTLNGAGTSNLTLTGANNYSTGNITT